jgi:predicted permease
MHPSSVNTSVMWLVGMIFGLTCVIFGLRAQKRKKNSQPPSTIDTGIMIFVMVAGCLVVVLFS